MTWRVIFCWLLATTFAHASFRHSTFSKFPGVHQHLVAALTVRIIEIANTNSQKVYPASGVQTDPNGLLYMRARYYNPYISRFINADPSGFGGGLNMYAFCNGNPISLADPFGLGVVDSAYQRSWEDTGDVMLAVLGKMASDLWNNSGTIATIGAFVLTDGLSVEAEAALETGVAETATAEESMTLYRVVGPDELSGLQQTSQYAASSGGLEVKYFYPTSGQAANFAANPANAEFGPFTLTSTRVPASVLNSSTAVNVATEGQVITIPNGQLPSVGTPTIHPSIPVPGH